MGGYKLTKEVFENEKVDESLEKYAKNGHVYLSFYTEYNENYFKNDEIYLFFNNVENWEDEDDKCNFINNSNNNKKFFVRCMNYQIDESVAMWKSYGYPNNIRIRFKAQELRNALGINKNSSRENEMLNCKFKFKSFDEEITVVIHQSYLKLYDVLYYSRKTEDINKEKKKSKYYVEKGTFNLKDVTYKQMEAINPRYLKRNAFSSEKETRFYFEFDEMTFNELFKTQFDIEKYRLCDLENIKVILKFKNKTIEKDSIKITRIPKFLITKSHNNQQNDSNDIQKILKIPNWNIEISDSELYSRSDFIVNDFDDES